MVMNVGCYEFLNNKRKKYLPECNIQRAKLFSGNATDPLDPSTPDIGDLNLLVLSVVENLQGLGRRNISVS
jgi:hypothetical protein